MRKLSFELTTSAPLEKIWSVISDINNYHKYIKYCYYSHLVGDFKEGSTWYDFSTVAFIPLRINHKIIKIIPYKKIVYLIKTPIVEIWQTILIEESKNTRLKLEVTIDFPNRLIGKILGTFLYVRNRQMLEKTMQNYKKSFSED